MQAKVSKRTVLWIVPILVIVALFFYFKPESNQDEYITLAKQFVVPDSNTTFEQSLSTHCDKEKWMFFETNRGQKVVEFRGKCALDGTAPLNIQFLIADENTAKIGAMLFDHEQVAENEKPIYYDKLAMK